VRTEGGEALALALGAWAVTSGQRRRLVEKEQRGVVAGWHRCSHATLEVEHADDPAPALILAQRVILLVVQAAAIAHQRAARRGCDNIAEWADAISKGHE
jgi:hypothetical protein